MIGRTVELRPFPGMQERACTSPADELLLGGMAGPGKSWTLLFMDIPDIVKFPDLRILFMRRETPDLGSLIDLAKTMYIPMGAEFVSRHSYYQRAAFLFPRYNSAGNPIPGTIGEGAIAIFGHCQREDDKEKYSGFEFQRLRIDELQQFTESQYLFLFSRVRTTNKRIWCNIRASCNPNGIGMLWLKRRFVDRILPGTVRSFRRIKGIDTEVPATDPLSLSRSWLPGDRKENLALGSDYEAMLAQLSERDHAALALGLWEMPRVDGQLVDPAWWDRAIAGKDLAPDVSTVKAMGADFGHRGGDLCVFAHGRGRKLLGMHSFQTDHGQEFAWRLWKAAEEFGTALKVVVGVDSNGPGAVAADLLESGGIWVDGKTEKRFGKIGNLNRCTQKDDRFDARYRGAIRFNSFKAQMWWKFREDLRNGRIDLSCLASEDCTFDGVDELAEEVLAHTYSSDVGVLEIISKRELRKAENLGRSPDRADALVIWNWVREFGGGERTVDDQEWDRWSGIDRYMKNFKEEMDDGDNARERPTLV